MLRLLSLVALVPALAFGQATRVLVKKPNGAVSSVPGNANASLNVNVEATAGLTDTQLRATPVPVGDGGASLTVDGSVTANQGTAAAGSGAWPMAVTTTTDTVVKPGDSTNNAVRVNVVAGGGSGGTSSSYGAAFPATGTAAGAKVVASPPTYTGGNMEAPTLDTAGNLRVNVVAGGGSGGTSSTFGAAFPGTGTAAGWYDGTNMVGARTFDGDSGAGTQNIAGAVLRKSASGGSVEAGTATDPLRVDPTGTTTQPTSDTHTTAAGPLSVRISDGTSFLSHNTNGQKTMANSAPVVIASDQSAVPVADGGGSLTVDGTVTANAGTGPAAASGWFIRLTDGTDTALVSGTGALLVDGSATTQPVSGTLTAVTSITNTVTVAGAAADNSAAGSTSTGTLPAVVETSATMPTRTDGNRAALIVDGDGKAYVRTHDADPLSASSGLSTATTLTQLVAAPGAGLSIYVTDVTFSSSAAATTTTDQQMTLKRGTGTNCGTGTGYVWGAFNPANGGAALAFSQPLKIATNEALCWIHAAAGSKIVTVGYFIAP